jgi:hypothetical protein
MRKRGEYQSKISTDMGLIRGRVSSTLLQAMNARPGNYLIFRLIDSNKAVMQIARARKKSGKGKRCS